MQGSSFSPETALSDLFAPVLIMALGAATGTPLAFMRLMKVGAGGNDAALRRVRPHGFVNLQTLPD